MCAQHRREVAVPEVGHVGGQEGEIVPYCAAFGSSCDINTVVSSHRSSQRSHSVNADDVKDKTLVIGRFVRDIPTELEVHIPHGMNVLFEGIHAISKLAVSGGDGSGSVTEGSVLNLLKFSPSDGLTRALLVYPTSF